MEEKLMGQASGSGGRRRVPRRDMLGLNSAGNIGSSVNPIPRTFMDELPGARIAPEATTPSPPLATPGMGFGSASGLGRPVGQTGVQSLLDLFTRRRPQMSNMGK